jgi:hypothetical protein
MVDFRVATSEQHTIQYGTCQPVVVNGRWLEAVDETADDCCDEYPPWMTEIATIDNKLDA